MFTMAAYRGPIVWDSINDFYPNLAAYFGRDKSLLDDRMSRCVSCTARREARQPVLTEGDPNAKILLLGQNPGSQEDAKGRPFVGDSWERLKYWLQVLGVTRDDCLVSNAVLCHTTQNRKPLSHEVAVCAAWKAVESLHWDYLRYVFLFGGTALDGFFGPSCPTIMTMFGQTQQVLSQAGRRYLVFPFFHPSFVLRQPERNQECVNYMDFARQIIELDCREELRWLI